jgi:hypothetical protein
VTLAARNEKESTAVPTVKPNVVRVWSQALSSVMLGIRLPTRIIRDYSIFVVNQNFKSACQQDVFQLLLLLAWTLTF